MLLFIEWYPSVPLSLKQNKHKSQKTKKHKTATITTSTNRASTKNFITMTSFWQTYKLQPLICSLVTRTNARVLFFPLWRQEWLMTTQEVWFNHRSHRFPIIHASKSCWVWVVARPIVTRVIQYYLSSSQNVGLLCPYQETLFLVRKKKLKT